MMKLMVAFRNFANAPKKDTSTLRVGIKHMPSAYVWRVSVYNYTQRAVNEHKPSRRSAIPVTLTL
jgi:hypothetical protein